MFTVYFKNCTGHRYKIATVDIYGAAFVAINDFLKKHNYTSYITRTWMVDEKITKVDVGSHTEFFYIVEG